MMMKIKVLGKILMIWKINKIQISHHNNKKRNKNNVSKKISNKWYKLQKKVGKKDHKVLAINRNKNWMIILLLRQADQSMDQDNNKEYKIYIFLYQQKIHILDLLWNT